MSDSGRPPLQSFATTRWTLVLQAGQSSNPGLRRQALGQLLQRYEPAIRKYLVVFRRIERGRAEDLLRDFTGRLLERDVIASADPNRGRFRTFLLTALKNYLIDEARRANAAKRRHGPTLEVSEILDQAPTAAAPDPFEQEYARCLLAEVLQRMRTDCTDSGRSDVWGIFEQRLLRPILNEEAACPYEELAERYGFKSPSQAMNALMTAKRIFRRLLTELVSETVADEADVQSEILDLQRILAGS